MAIDEKKKADLLARFGKFTTLIIDKIEDDSSDTTQVKILNLVEAVTATGSNPTPGGLVMSARSSQVYVAADDIDKMLEQCEEKDGKLVYRGQMHLDVSKPATRTVNGQTIVTKPSKIWLTATKFSRRGGELRQNQSNNLNSLIDKMFAGGAAKPLDLAAEAAKATEATNSGNRKEEEPEPKVVGNKVS